jgi:hypothetical protein
MKSIDVELIADSKSRIYASQGRDRYASVHDYVATIRSVNAAVMLDEKGVVKDALTILCLMRLEKRIDLEIAQVIESGEILLSYADHLTSAICAAIRMGNVHIAAALTAGVELQKMLDEEVQALATGLANRVLYTNQEDDSEVAAVEKIMHWLAKGRYKFSATLSEHDQDKLINIVSMKLDSEVISRISSESLNAMLTSNG